MDIWMFNIICICVVYVWWMLTKQTYLTQTGPGIKRPVLHFKRKIPEIQLESQSAGDPNAEKQRSAGRKKIRDIREQPNQGTESHNGQRQPPRRICRGTRENLEDPQGISASTEKQKVLQLQTTPGNNPLGEEHHPSRIQLHKCSTSNLHLSLCIHFSY